MNDNLMELPKGWELSALEDICNHVSGTAFKSTEFTTQGIQVIRLGNIYKGQLNLSRDPVFLPPSFTTTSFVLKPGNIIVSQTGTRFKRDYGYFVLIPENAPKLFLNQRLLAISCHPSIEPEYVVLASKLKTYQDYFFSQETGGVNQGNVGVAGVMKGSIPLAPSNEQKRIVAQIEALRERSQKAKAALEAIPELCDRFRQSVLAAAFRGDSTADWREENPDVEPASVLLERIRRDRRRKWEENELEKMYLKGKIPRDNTWKEKYQEPEPINETLFPELPDGWCWVPVELLSTKVVDGVHKKPDYVEKGIPFVTVKNLTAGTGISFDDLNYVSPEDHKEFYKRANPERGDLLITKDGTLGVTRVVRTDYIFSIFVSVALVKPVTYEMSDYLELVFSAPQMQEQMTGTGSGLKHIHLKDLRRYAVPVAPLQEQKEIIALVRRYLSLLDKQINVAEECLKRSEYLNQSILAKAFRGELVEQDPNDEPAAVLLERIRAEREAQQPAKQKQRKGSKRSKSTELGQINLSLE